MAGLTNAPILILKEGHTRETGKDAQRRNIHAAKAVADVLKTTLGPKGMDKMMVDGTGDIVITNDGATILREMDIEHPVAKMIVEVARAQEDEVGDGTTSAVVIAGGLLENAEELINIGVHPTVIVMGYKAAQNKAYEFLEEMAVAVSKEDLGVLKKIAETAMTGKGIEIFKDMLSDICIDAAAAIEEDGKVDVEERVKFVKISGGSVKETVLIHGVVLDKERLNPDMPKKIEGAKIALLDSTLELKKLSTDAKVTISSPESLSSFREGEDEVLKEKVEAMAKVGANVVFCKQGIGAYASRYLANYGIIAARRVSDEDLKFMALATGGKIVTDPLEMREEDLGAADLVGEKKVGKEKKMIFVEGCHGARAVTAVVHGSSEQLRDNVERALEDALWSVATVLESKKIVPGGGAPEIEVAERLRQYATTITGRDQLAVRAFADAVEEIPVNLAENAGFDSIDVLVGLRSSHGAGNKGYGLDINTGKAADMMAQGVVEPLKVKTQAIKSGTAAATLVLRVDDVIAAKVEGLKPKPGQSPHDYTRRPMMPPMM
ncbi:thermosome subunit alpha [Methanotrichaceae archaeon M04Ac]|uniref:Thermosome subunit alpha n=1 Tax=Candidatus Methanocrinis alkalitolerans TaxID=3033395 RepID=A0ABT5XCU8_9EURY|nr:thermosome subunit alpha [Candidatus Methanocrinis alkalitolerans]MCR3883855.1 thermosome subunit [Methanothrix sp.]MDF0592538.1 thermosome subunit alpha [Candidatus Methanocrinis alkalitolerans]